MAWFYPDRCTSVISALTSLIVGLIQIFYKVVTWHDQCVIVLWWMMSRGETLWKAVSSWRIQARACSGGFLTPNACFCSTVYIAVHKVDSSHDYMLLSMTTYVILSLSSSGLTCELITGSTSNHTLTVLSPYRAHFGINRLRGLGVARGQISRFISLLTYTGYDGKLPS